MSTKREQIGQANRIICMGRSETRKLKQATHRADRREAKKNPEDAPKRPRYRGWRA